MLKAYSSLFQQTSQWHIHTASLLYSFSHGHVNIFIFCPLKNFLFFIGSGHICLFKTSTLCLSIISSHVVLIPTFYSLVRYLIDTHGQDSALTIFCATDNDRCFLFFILTPRSSFNFINIYTGQLNSN